MHTTRTLNFVLPAETGKPRVSAKGVYLRRLSSLFTTKHCVRHFNYGRTVCVKNDKGRSQNGTETMRGKCITRVLLDSGVTFVLGANMHSEIKAQGIFEQELDILIPHCCPSGT